MRRVRVRFAPSPTGGLHLGGVRTALYNYLFAHRKGGDFVLRIEDTDRTRFVEGAEQYIIDCLDWAGIPPDESPVHGGEYGPYRQSERKEIYRKYAEQLIESGHAYYAFDTPEEIEALREKLRAEGKENLQYGYDSRMLMKNSLTLSVKETQKLISEGAPYVIRVKVEPGITIQFNDIVRGPIEMSTDTVDDKVLLKADGMPTYHLAVVVDDHLMQISHSFRGEEWLPSAPVHVLLYKYLGWEDVMPQWAHLPLILKPDGNGKLSKRDGQRLGFPVFAMEWEDPNLGLIQGFKELGFLPQAFINMLAMLGWNDGSGKELFSLDELVEVFSMERVQSHGAKFDYEKAKWFNHEWIKKMDGAELLPYVLPVLEKEGLDLPDNNKIETIINLVKERCVLLTDFVAQSSFFFKKPDVQLDLISGKWDEKKTEFFKTLSGRWSSHDGWNHDELETSFKSLAGEMQLKPGEVLLPLRVMLVGGKFGPGVFDIALQIGREETLSRINEALSCL
ncbi:MAG: glutamate--tRNA ligase [Chitinophagaceae bacterium]|nr:glutamate--tRNA ligase [Chitinophagaceae bacterium]